MNDGPIDAQLHTWVMPQIPSERMTYTPLTPFQLERLHADLHPGRVASRTGGGGNKLSYLEAYDVKATLVRIFGYGNFSVEVVDTRIVHESTYSPENQPAKVLHRIGALATVRLTLHQTGAVYTESAAASQSGPEWGEVADFAIKTAESDALKRCAIYLGSTFGLSLYNDGSTQDIVRYVYAPDQKDVIDDLRLSRMGGDEGEAARTRMQARLKTRTLPDPAARALVNAAEARQEPVEQVAAHDIISEPADTTIGEPVPEPQAADKAPARPRAAVKAAS